MKDLTITHSNKVLIIQAKKKLIQKAKKKYGKIFPCSYNRTFSECFTIHEDTLYFWFNIKGEYTHVVKKKIA